MGKTFKHRLPLRSFRKRGDEVPSTRFGPNAASAMEWFGKEKPAEPAKPEFCNQCGARIGKFKFTIAGHSEACCSSECFEEFKQETGLGN